MALVEASPGTSMYGTAFSSIWPYADYDVFHRREARTNGWGWVWTLRRDGFILHITMALHFWTLPSHIVTSWHLRPISYLSTYCLFYRFSECNTALRLNIIMEKEESMKDEPNGFNPIRVLGFEIDDNPITDDEWYREAIVVSRDCFTLSRRFQTIHQGSKCKNARHSIECVDTVAPRFRKQALNCGA